MDATRPPKKNAHTAKISSSSNLSVDGILHLFEPSGYDHVHSLEKGISMTSATNENPNNLENCGKVINDIEKNQISKSVDSFKAFLDEMM